MSLESNRRRFLALASFVLTAAGSSAVHGQGSPAYSSDNPNSFRRPEPEAQLRPEGIPEDFREQVIKDVGSWRVVSQYNQSTASILDDRVKVDRGGIEGLVAGGSRLGSISDGIAMRDANGNSIVPLAAEPEPVDPSRRILIGGTARLSLEYWSTDGGFQGTLRISPTSNMQRAMPVTILLDGTPVRSLTVTDFADIAVADLFGADLAGLASAKSLVVKADINGQMHTIYEVELAGTDEALKQMRLVPDYNYDVRRLGRKSDVEGAREKQGGSPAQCFLTTACCEIVGLADDCFELQSLRRFRDRVMLASPAGRRDIALYYGSAPLILAEMRRRGETFRLRGLYFGTILPCALMARLGIVGPTRFLYARMMRRLAIRYG